MLFLEIWSRFWSHLGSILEVFGVKIGEKSGVATKLLSSMLGRRVLSVLLCFCCRIFSENV
jgi:p-aminobenzoyl-glutamate transporter AbgT